MTNSAAAADSDSPTRERILDAALDAFSQQGFDGATTRSIARAAGVNLGLLSYYFGTKDDLWRAAVERAFDALRAGIGDEVRDGHELDDRARTALLIRRYVRFVARHPEFVRLMHEEGKRDSERMHWLVDNHVKPLYLGLRELIQRGQRSGRMAAVDPLHLHYILVGAVALIFHQAPECRRMAGRDPTDDGMVEAHAEALIRLFLGSDPAHDLEDPS
jgi:TetR/AcrR family transcriptional regulator